MKNDLYNKILNTSNTINNMNRNGYGNYLIVNPTIAEVLNNVFDEQEHKRKLKERKLKIEKILNRIK